MSALPTTKVQAIRGDTIPMRVTDIVDFDGNTVTNLAGWSAWFTVKHAATDADPGVLQKSTAAGTISFSAGVASWSISATESKASFTAGQKYVFDVQLRDPDGRVGTVVKGVLLIEEEITNE